ncbi:MAG: hypothetical protein IKO51_11105 [Clostridia bacterium]|nr:hypothetical protein [Clostridia bacterium]
MKRILLFTVLCAIIVSTACSTEVSLKHENLDAKIVSFKSFAEMEEYADVIVQVIREEAETPVVIREGEDIVSGFTFSQVRIEKICKDRTAVLHNGDSIRILENEFFDEKSNTVFHIAGYDMMKEGHPYLLFLTRHIYDDGGEYYVPAGVHYGTVSLDEDGRTIHGADDESFRLFWNEARSKYTADN